MVEMHTQPSYTRYSACRLLRESAFNIRISGCRRCSLAAGFRGLRRLDRRLGRDKTFLFAPKVVGMWAGSRGRQAQARRSQVAFRRRPTKRSVRGRRQSEQTTTTPLGIEPPIVFLGTVKCCAQAHSRGVRSPDEAV